MKATRLGLISGLVLALLLGTNWAIGADEPITDFDALALQPEPVTSVPVSGATKLLGEVVVGHENRRYGQSEDDISRVSVDYRTSFRVTEYLSGSFSARIDSMDPPAAEVQNPALSLREAYLTWQSPGARQLVEIGRVNLREGPGYGYNPTDFFRYNALRTISTIDPVSLRETRLGTVMLRGQQLWPSASVDVLFAPKLESERSHKGFSADWGATNSRSRGQVALGSRISETANSRVLLYKEAGEDLAAGASLTSLVSDSSVVHAEWSGGKEPTLLQRALKQNSQTRFGSRFAGGLTYTTASRLSLTAEYQYNGFALDRKAWQALTQAPLGIRIAYFGESLDRQDNAARHAILLYAVQRDLGIKNLELTALLKLNRADNSRLTWLELRYHFDRADLALRLQDNTGAAGAEFGTAPVRNSAGLLFSYYFL
ncbi:MAG: hypothetical protein ABIN96_08420 [Rubrivivax sp.]